MKWNDYEALTEQIIQGSYSEKPYDDPKYVELTKLNRTRSKRWLRNGKIDTKTTNIITSISEPQTWLLIVEPWCSDGANAAPFIKLLADLNKLIKLDIRLRDVEPELIDRYLTNGSRSIPKLIVSDKDERDLFTWGPRPEACLYLVRQWLDSGMDAAERKARIQRWYQQDAGKSLITELRSLVQGASAFA